MYEIILTKQAIKDDALIKKSGLKDKLNIIIRKMQEDPFCVSPPYEKLKGDLQGAYSRRINLQHRLVYTVDKKNKIIMVVRMWTHYE